MNEYGNRPRGADSGSFTGTTAHLLLGPLVWAVHLLVIYAPQPALCAAVAAGTFGPIVISVFVLAATSNPEGASVQRAVTDGQTVAQSIVDAAAALNAEHDGPGSVGVVVGATVSSPPDVSALGGPVLVPGVGAQGGQPEELRGFAGSRPGQLLPAVSREILRAGPDVDALRAAAAKFRDAVAYLA